MAREVTIKDIAKAAGVSVATVSRVINDNYPVSKEARRAGAAGDAGASLST